MKNMKRGNSVIKMPGAPQIKNTQAVAINMPSHCHNLLPVLEEQISSSEPSFPHTYKFVNVWLSLRTVRHLPLVIKEFGTDSRNVRYHNNLSPLSYNPTPTQHHSTSVQTVNSLLTNSKVHTVPTKK